MSEAPATKRVTLKQVAGAAGVSSATASYVLSGRHDRPATASLETQERVLSSARALGYQVNASARTLRRQRTELIGLVYQPPVGPWLDELSIELEDAAVQRNSSVVGIPVRRVDRVELSLRAVERGYLDGVIFCGTFDGAINFRRIAQRVRAVGVITLEAEDIGEHIDVFYGSARAAVSEATTALIASGRRRLAYLSHSNTLGGGSRFEGFREAARHAGVPLDPSWIVPGADDHETAARFVTALLEHPEPPDAIVCESDRGALYTLEVARRLGVLVPDALAVVGMGNTRAAQLSTPTVTSLGMSTPDLGVVAQHLFDRIEEPDLPRVSLAMPWSVHARESTPEGFARNAGSPGVPRSASS